jgi:hypothetical protein
VATLQTLVTYPSNNRSIEYLTPFVPHGLLGRETYLSKDIHIFPLGKSLCHLSHLINLDLTECIYFRPRKPRAHAPINRLPKMSVGSQTKPVRIDTIGHSSPKNNSQEQALQLMAEMVEVTKKDRDWKIFFPKQLMNAVVVRDYKLGSLPAAIP